MECQKVKRSESEDSITTSAGSSSPPNSSPPNSPVESDATEVGTSVPEPPRRVRSSRGPAKMITEHTLAEKLSQATNLMVLTGAGISAESGIPTYRGADGFWTERSNNYQPSQLFTWKKFNEMPGELWHSYECMAEVFDGTMPNAGHQALVELEQLVKAESSGEFHLVTQNIDGLHTRAGSENVFEIHGRVDQIRCDERTQGACLHDVDLNAPANFAKVRSTIEPPPELSGLRKCPTCAVCGVRQRPNILFFDEKYNESIFWSFTVRRAMQRTLVQSSDVLLIIGTQHGAGLPYHLVSNALAEGTTVIKIDTQIDVADPKFAGMHCLQAQSGECLPRVVSLLAKMLDEAKEPVVKQPSACPLLHSAPMDLSPGSKLLQSALLLPSAADYYSTLPHPQDEAWTSHRRLPVHDTVFQSGQENTQAPENEWDWSEWQEVPYWSSVKLTCVADEPLGLNTDGGTDGAVYVESVRPKTWGARMYVESPCKIVGVNGVDVTNLPQMLFNGLMQQRPVTIAFKAMQRIKAARQLTRNPSEEVTPKSSSHVTLSLEDNTPKKSYTPDVRRPKSLQVLQKLTNAQQKRERGRSSASRSPPKSKQLRKLALQSITAAQKREGSSRSMLKRKLEISAGSSETFARRRAVGVPTRN